MTKTTFLEKTGRVTWSFSVFPNMHCLLRDKSISHRSKYYDILFTDSSTNKNCKIVNIENCIDPYPSEALLCLGFAEGDTSRGTSTTLVKSYNLRTGCGWQAKGIPPGGRPIQREGRVLVAQLKATIGTEHNLLSPSLC